MSLDFRDIDTRLKAGAFLEELNQLLNRHGMKLTCWGYECEGVELEVNPGPPQRWALPDKISSSGIQWSVKLKEEEA